MFILTWFLSISFGILWNGQCWLITSYWKDSFMGFKLCGGQEREFQERKTGRHLTSQKWPSRKLIFVALFCVCVYAFTKSFPHILQGDPKQCWQKGALGDRWGLWALWCSLFAQEGWERWGAETSLTPNAGQQNVNNCVTRGKIHRKHVCVCAPPAQESVEMEREPTIWKGWLHGNLGVNKSGCFLFFTHNSH